MVTVYVLSSVGDVHIFIIIIIFLLPAVFLLFHLIIFMFA